MGYDIAYIKVKLSDNNLGDLFAKIYNKVMQEQESWYQKEYHEISAEDVLNKGDGILTADGIDAHGLFENPNDTALRYVVKEFISQAPESEFSVIYDLSWDNCGEGLVEDYRYKDKTLKVEFSCPIYEDELYEDDEFDENDYFDDEIKYGILNESMYKYDSVKDKLELIKGDNIFPAKK